MTRVLCPKSPEQRIRKRSKENREKFFLQFLATSLAPKRMLIDITANVGTGSRQMSCAGEGNPQAH